MEVARQGDEAMVTDTATSTDGDERRLEEEIKLQVQGLTQTYMWSQNLHLEQK